MTTKVQLKAAWGVMFAAALLATLASGCAVKMDRDYPNQLTTKLRILAIGSEPAELRLGEAGVLSALVYTPPDLGGCSDPEPSYAWSWCPARGGEESAFECLLSESEARALYASLGGAGDFPSYDLGTSETATLENTFGDLTELVCSEGLEDDDASAQVEYLTCLAALTPSVRLEVSSCGQSAIAIKSLSLLGETASNDADYIPNQNPTMTGDLRFRSPGGGDELPLGAPLENGKVYWMNLKLDDVECESEAPEDACLAEIFTPLSPLGDPEDPRREILVLSWYLTKGHTAPDKLNGEEYAPDTGSSLGQQTFYRLGDEGVEELLQNVVDLTEATPGDAQLYVVLRDERGGIAWRTFDFTVEAE